MLIPIEITQFFDELAPPAHNRTVCEAFLERVPWGEVDPPHISREHLKGVHVTVGQRPYFFMYPKGGKIQFVHSHPELVASLYGPNVSVGAARKGFQLLHFTIGSSGADSAIVELAKESANDQGFALEFDDRVT